MKLVPKVTWLHPRTRTRTLCGQERRAVRRLETLETGPGLAALCQCWREMGRGGHEHTDLTLPGGPASMAVTWCVSALLSPLDMGDANTCLTRAL